MKLFNAIAVAAFIGTSLITATPAEARNGWMYLGRAGGHSYYFRPNGCTGMACSVGLNASDGFSETYNIDCKNYTAKSQNTRGWKEIMPGTPLYSVASSVCD